MNRMKILSVFGLKSDLPLSTFRFFAFPFSYLFAAVVRLLLGLLSVKKFRESFKEMGIPYHELAKVEDGDFCPSFSPSFR